jgi:hypothetical protein
MDLVAKFDMANTSRTVSVGSLEVEHRYQILHSERVDTKFGSSVVFTIGDGAAGALKVFLPKRYSCLIKDKDIADTNNQTVSLHLIYKGRCAKTHAYILNMES